MINANGGPALIHTLIFQVKTRSTKQASPSTKSQPSDYSTITTCVPDGSTRGKKFDKIPVRDLVHYSRSRGRISPNRIFTDGGSRVNKGLVQH